MNKLAFYGGYMKKEAAGLGASGGATVELLRNLVKYPTLVGAPILGGYMGGRAMADVKEPTSQEVSTLQATYVRDKLKQAIEDLEKKRQIENLKEQFGGASNTLRI